MAPRPDRHTDAFTLVELLVAVILGSLLVVAMALVLQLFSAQVEDLRNEGATPVEESLSTIADEVRRAWWVEVPSATRLDIHDPYGNATSYYLDGQTLKVRRPDGRVGDVLTGVASLQINGQTTTRYREDTPADVNDDWWTVPAGATTETLTLEQGDEVAIGFTVPTTAPGYIHPLASVEEQVVEATVERLVLPISFVNASDMEFCHLWHGPPPHNPSHPLGPTPLSIDLYRARAPNDPRPHGPVLASAAIPVAAIPQTSHIWWNLVLEAPEFVPEVIDPPNGVAWGWWDDHPEVVFLIPDPLLAAQIPLGPLALPVKPGEAYCLVIRPTDLTFFNLLTTPGVTSPSSPVSLKRAGGSFMPQNMTVTFTVGGSRRFTQTTEHDVIDRVTATITMTDGTVRQGTVLVAGQVVADDPWLGVVPQEIPALEQSGY